MCVCACVCVCARTHMHVHAHARARVCLELGALACSGTGDDDAEGPPQRLTLALAARSSGVGAEELIGVKQLRLDWLRIGAIENLEAVSQVSELYLQHVSAVGVRRRLVSARHSGVATQNCIRRIEGLSELRELTFLALGGNRISVVRGRACGRTGADTGARPGGEPSRADHGGYASGRARF